MEHVPGLAARGIMDRILRDGDFAHAFYGGSIRDANALSNVAERLDKGEYPRSELANILRRQNDAWGAPDETRQNIEKLESGALTIITGQQAGLFSGPAYTIYKALAAIAWADAASEELGRDVVPVFWIAGDDADLDEIDHAVLPGGADGPITLRYDAMTQGPRVSRLRFDDDISAWLDEALAAFPKGPGTEPLFETLRAAYAPGASWVDAFAKLMSSWFGRFGLILVNPDDGAMKRLSGRVLRAELEDPERSAKELSLIHI